MVEGRMMTRKEANNDDLRELQWLQEQDEKRREVKREKKKRQKEKKREAGAWSGGLVRVPMARQAQERRDRIARLEREAERLRMEDAGENPGGKDRFHPVTGDWGEVKWVDSWAGGSDGGAMMSRWSGGKGKW